MPCSASWAWRSIIAGREVLRRGRRWRVGEGKMINIWSDLWIPRSYSFNDLDQPPKRFFVHLFRKSSLTRTNGRLS